MHILLVPDSFKDSISATAIIAQLEQGFANLDASITTEHCIASDGGEGFLDFVKRYREVTMISVNTIDPLGRDIVADYAFAKASQTAYIELATASGLELLANSERNPLKTSTYGTGLQIKDAIEKGCKEIFVGLGGSATNDGGTGIASALGYDFLDNNDQSITPKGNTLCHIDHIVKPKLQLPKIVAVNDVDNPLTGLQGAAYTYAKQKGATPQDIIVLDTGLEHLATRVKKELAINAVNTAGAGAAGGTAYGLRVFCNASFVRGVHFLASLSGIEERLAAGSIDLIVTGEGSIDAQTRRGKLVKGIAALGSRYDIPVVAICGVNRLDETATIALGLNKVFTVSDLALSKEDSIANAGHYIKQLSSVIYKSGLRS